jgi:predicted anti-sigma-YlaC factor YlaD
MSDAYTCQQIVEVVTEYLEGGLVSSDRLAFERHVAICPPCRGYLSQIRWVTRVAGSFDAEDIPTHMRDDLLSAFAEWKQGRSPR